MVIGNNISTVLFKKRPRNYVSPIPFPLDRQSGGHFKSYSRLTTKRAPFVTKIECYFYQLDTPIIYITLS